MNIEVEQKHHVENSAALLERLTKFGARFGPSIVQLDEYFAHPSRDFAATDEALRIRTVGDASVVTYKGPKLDATTNSRRELELPLATSQAEFAELLVALGFTPVTVVRKSRRPFRIEYRGQNVHGAWDDVEGVGTFVELELSADDASLAEAKRIIAELSHELKLGPSVRESYLELLLSSRH